MVIFPNFAVGQGMLDLYTNYQVSNICVNASKYCEYLKTPCCKYYNDSDPSPCGSQECLDWTENYMSWRKPGLLRFFTFMPIQFLIQFTALLLFEAGVFRKLFYQIKLLFIRKNVVGVISEQQEEMERLYGDIKKDDDVLFEEARISNLVNQQGISPGQTKEIFIIDQLIKHYSNFMAVKGISFSMEKGECFGLLGINFFLIDICIYSIFLKRNPK